MSRRSTVARVQAPGQPRFSQALCASAFLCLANMRLFSWTIQGLASLQIIQYRHLHDKKHYTLSPRGLRFCRVRVLHFPVSFPVCAVIFLPASLHCSIFPSKGFSSGSGKGMKPDG